jgi:hypothetical protein
MNKHLLKSCQQDKERELNNLYSTYHRMNQFYYISQQYGKDWTLTEYNAFWAWYYHSNINAKEALDRIKE